MSMFASSALVTISENLRRDSGVSVFDAPPDASWYIFEHLDKITFDTRLSYLRIGGSVDVVLSLPAMSYSSSGVSSQVYSFGNIPDGISSSALFTINDTATGAPFNTFHYFGPRAIRFFKIYPNFANRRIEAMVNTGYGYQGSVPGVTYNLTCNFLIEV